MIGVSCTPATKTVAEFWRALPRSWLLHNGKAAPAVTDEERPL